MNAKAAATSAQKPPQEVCIDLPGESVQCWRSSDNIKVILRKHRDVFFDINIKKGDSYSVDSTHDFYYPKQKKLLKRLTFNDGERLHIWVGREFKGKILLKSGAKILSTIEPTKLDNKTYDKNPKTKPEPLMVILGKKELVYPLVCTPEDRFGLSNSQSIFKPMMNPQMSFLKTYGTDFKHEYSQEQPEIKEYACVAEANASEIQPQVLKQLNSGVAVEGNIDQIFIQPKPNTLKSDLYSAMGIAAGYISGNEIFTANWLKESAGYFQENWKQMNKILMRVWIEKKPSGKYRVLFKGKPLNRVVSQVLGTAANAKVLHKRVPLGSAASAFVDGGFGRTGKAGFGGLKRMMLTTSQNFHGGLKIQIIGTIIDLIGDANTVFGNEKGSKDLSEFLGRAGISLVKAGATAAIGSVITAGVAALATLLFGVSALPVFIAVGVAIGAYILAATIVDKVDDYLQIKESAAKWAR